MDLGLHFRLGTKPSKEDIEEHRVRLAEVVAKALEGELWDPPVDKMSLQEVQGGELDAKEAAELVCSDDGFLELTFVRDDGHLETRDVILSDLIMACHRVNCYNKNAGRSQLHPKFYENGAPMVPLEDSPYHLRVWLLVAAFGERAISGHFYGERRGSRRF